MHKRFKLRDEVYEETTPHEIPTQESAPVSDRAQGKGSELDKALTVKTPYTDYTQVLFDKFQDVSFVSDLDKYNHTRENNTLTKKRICKSTASQKDTCQI